MAYTTGIKGNDLTKEDIDYVLVMQFGETLTKGSLNRYSRLPKNSTYIKVHSGEQKVERKMKVNFKIQQGDTELLRNIADRFQS